MKFVSSEAVSVIVRLSGLASQLFALCYENYAGFSDS